MIIGIIGGASVPDKVYREAEEVGALVAESGAVLICGGLSGVMEAACKGAKSKGGTTIGILPGSDTGEANPYVDIPVATGMGYSRNVIIALTADAVIAVDGSYGTLSEIAHCLNFGKTVVALDTWELRKAGEVDPARFLVAKGPKDAVSLALEVCKSLGKTD